jgi:peroxiredoxin Q/BCP
MASAAARSKSAGSGGTGLEIGDRVPDFTLDTDSEGTISRASLKGRPYVLYFYPKDDTSGCTREGLDFTAAAAKFARLGVQVIGVSRDSLESHGKFRRKHKLKLTLASDPDIAAAQSFGVWVEKSMYGRKYMGLERASFLVDAGGRIAAAWRKVKVPGHVATVLEEAKKL